MRLLFHTIALEPARWTPGRTSRPLTELLPHIAAAGFCDLEIYEPHLGAASVSGEIKDCFEKYELVPEILSSYINLNPAATPDAEVEAAVEQILKRVEYYGFRKIRIFPGPGLSPSDYAGIDFFLRRLEQLLARLPETEILLETHDGSLADDPETITRIVREIASPRVGLLYQPTFFEPEKALSQFEIEKPFIRHLHLQNRDANLGFVTLRDGVIPWREILLNVPPAVAATLEFVPAGICSVEEFDLEAVLDQARSEADYVRAISG